MLTKKFTDILKLLLPISNSAVLQNGNTFICDKSKNLIARIDMETINEGQTLEESFGVMNLGKFTSLISTFEKDGAITYNMNDGILHLQTPNYDFDYYVYNQQCLQDYQLNPAFITQLLSVPKMMTFDLSSDIIKNIKDVSNTFELKHIVLGKHHEEGYLSVSVTEIKKNSSADNLQRHTLSIKVPGALFDDEEEFILDVSKLNKLPVDNYKGVVYYVKNRASSLHLTSTSLPGLDFFLAKTSI